MRKVAFESAARALQPLRHALLERERGFGRHALPHHPEAACRKRQEQWRLDHVSLRQHQNIVDSHRCRRVEPAISAPKKPSILRS